MGGEAPTEEREGLSSMSYGDMLAEAKAQGIPEKAADKAWTANEINRRSTDPSDYGPSGRERVQDPEKARVMAEAASSMMDESLRLKQKAQELRNDDRIEDPTQHDKADQILRSARSYDNLSQAAAEQADREADYEAKKYDNKNN